jgi:hypothetical protein
MIRPSGNVSKKQQYWLNRQHAGDQKQGSRHIGCHSDSRDHYGYQACQCFGLTLILQMTMLHAI